MSCCTLLLIAVALQNSGPEVKTASGRPMKYYVALPEGWSKDRDWPVAVLIPDAGRDFAGNLAAFVRARGRRPYILVAPHVVTSGGANYRAAETYRYSEADWKRVKEMGDFRFDEEGVAAVLADVRRLYRGQDKACLTGWEAGGHTVWALLFRHPEWFRAIVPVSTNYQGRWVDDTAFSKDPSRGALPIRVLFCDKEAAGRGWEFFLRQTHEAIKTATEHGFRVPEPRVVPGKPHGPLAEAVLEFFDTVTAKR